MSAATLTRDLVITHARALKLPGMARTFEGLARQARDAHWPHEDYLQEVLSAELASRHESVIRQRLREARFPEVKTLDTFDFPAADGVNATQIHTLARGEWVTAPENLIFAGPIGTGKTHLAIALGVEATRQKRRVLFTRAADLVRQLLEARDARELTRLQQRLRRVEVLIVDELGFVPFDRVGGELLFNLITDRYERRATVVTTNLTFAEWVTVFAGDEKLTTALLARHADLRGIYCCGAGNRGIADALEASGRAREVVWITHELTQYTRRFLVRGTLDAIINQDPGHEARSAARVLLAHCSGEPISPDQERIRIDIFLRDNLP